MIDIDEAAKCYQHFTASDPPIWYQQTRGLAMNATQEEWRPVVGHECRYEVSSFGRVRSLDSEVPCRGGKLRKIKGRILGTSLGSTGYPRVSLAPNSTHRAVHRLVLEAFVGPRPDGLECCHNDGDPTNNRVENLRWDTHASNITDTVNHGTHTNASKTHCPQGHEMTPENVYIAPKRGERQCRKCRRVQYLAWQSRQR